MGTLRSNWREAPPLLVGSKAKLREVRADDGEPLSQELGGPDVTRFITPPPAGAEAFDRFVGWAVRQRESGLALYLSVMPNGYERAVGVMSLHAVGPERSQSAWNWGFAVGAAWWGSGLFQDAARLTLDFAFGPMDLEQVEAWSPLGNGRAHGAMGKLGGTPELMRDAHAPDGRHGTYVRWKFRKP